MKTFSNRFLAAASFLWGVSVFLWPNPSNVRLQREAEYRPVSVGEGLYKSELTKASSGLLGARFFESFEGRPSWNIRSEFAELHRQKDSYAFMKQVTADFFSGPKGNTIKTLSDYGRSHFDKRLVELEGNVVVRSQQGYRFTMDRLDYYGKTRRFRSNDWVQMAGPNIEKPEMFVTGTGFDGYLDSENFVFRKNTRARRRLSTQEWIRVQSASSEFQPSANRAVFHQNVKTLLPDLRIESDQLEMNIGDAGGELLKAKGHVVLFHKNRKGMSEKADIEIGKDRIVLEGQASIHDSENELTGKRITLYTNHDRVEVEQAAGSVQK